MKSAVELSGMVGFFTLAFSGVPFVISSIWQTKLPKIFTLIGPLLTVIGCGAFLVHVILKDAGRYLVLNYALNTICWAIIVYRNRSCLSSEQGE